MARTGRPKIQIDKSEFEKLCAIWCTETEIAGWFDTSISTLSLWCKRTYKMTFNDIFSQKSSKGAVSIRRKQFQMAMDGNVALLIWLGKQKLGQREPYEPKPTATVNVDGKAEIVLKWTDEDNAGDASANAAPKTI